jgi:glutathione S-transferase
MERYRAQEWLHYLSTEVHKLFTPLFFTDAWITVPEAKAPFREVVQQMLSQKCHYLANHLHKQPYLMGSQFSAPDAYLYTILNWSHYVKFDLTKWPALMGYMERLKNRPSVISTMEHEGLKRS